MPVPKRKRSRARRDSRFANKGIKVKAIAGCLNCKDPIVPHTACKKCGFYKGVKILATKADRKVKRLAVKAVKTPVKQASAESQAE
ncbi:MAG TPA: 50S ribosomal protein L32 [Candidatus Babeliales bacterium]|jgi:large subunit ribosomal protein L32|nr:50S ribosomal protein L32 [Candidatus Babeliales bacterium]